MIHEALLSLSIPLPIHNATVYTLYNGLTGPFWNGIHDNYTVDWEVHNSTGILQDTNYADIAAYTALELNREGNTTGARYELGLLNNDYDGKGMIDTVYTGSTSPEHGIYQTFKTALYLTVLNTLHQPIPPIIVPTILQTKGADGGFHTGYNTTSSAGTQENAETTSIVILALESFPPTLWVETSSWDGGYLGDSFFFYFSLTNNGTSWLNITRVTITLDYGIFKPPGHLGVIPPGQGGGGEGFQIPIPRTTAAGNHTLTLTTSFQTYDNASSTWVAKTPILETATLIVKPFPELDNRPALVAAITTVGLGLLFGFRTLRAGRRLSEAVRQKPVSMARTVPLLVLTVLAFYLFGFASLDYRFVFLIFFPPVAMVVLVAIAAGEANFVRRRYKPANLLPLVLLSLGATLASHVYVGVHGGGGQCGPGLLGAGFPLPWAAQTIPYLGPSLPVPFSCPSTAFTWWALTPVYFLLDTALYAALGIGIIEAYRNIRQRHARGITSPIGKVNGQASLPRRALTRLLRPDKLISRLLQR